MGTLRAGVGVQRADHPSFWERWEPQVQRTIGGYDLRLWGSKAGRHVTLASGGDGAALHIYCPLPQACSPCSKWPGHFLWPVKQGWDDRCHSQEKALGAHLVSFSPVRRVLQESSVRAAGGLSQLLTDPEHVKPTLLLLTTWHVGLAPDQGWMGKGHAHAMGYYSAIKKNEIVSFAATWMDLEIIIFKGSQPDKENFHMISLTCGI